MIKNWGFINGWSRRPLSFCIHKKKHYGATLIAKPKSVQMLETPGQSCVYTH